MQFFIILALFFFFPATGSTQCSSLYTTPEFPVATHPADQHTQSWGANIFTPTQFGPATTIGGIQIYVDNSFGATSYPTQTIYMRHTAVSSYPNANYPTTAGFTQVYNGTYNFPMSGLYTVVFNVAQFPYNGSQNVEILFENRSNVYRANEPWFRRTPTYGAGVYRSKWNGNFGFGGFPGTPSDGSAVRLTYTLSLSAAGGSGCGAILQENISHFTGAFRDGIVHLEWQALETPGDGWFTVERSEDGEHFYELARRDFIAGQQGEPQIYTAEDAHPGTHRTYYRLVKTDLNGGSEYSAVIEILSANADGSGMLAAPNPAQNASDIYFTLPATEGEYLEITDLLGKLVEVIQLEEGQTSLKMDLTGSASGIYWIQRRGGFVNSTLRLIKN